MFLYSKLDRGLKPCNLFLTTQMCRTMHSMVDKNPIVMLNFFVGQKHC